VNLLCTCISKVTNVCMSFWLQLSLVGWLLIFWVLMTEVLAMFRQCLVWWLSCWHSCEVSYLKDRVILVKVHSERSTDVNSVLRSLNIGHRICGSVMTYYCSCSSTQG
jgi:hypothetical protein